MGEHASLGKHRRPVPTDRRAEPAVFLVDAAGLGEEPGGERRGVGGGRQAIEAPQAALDGPAEVHGRGPGGGELLGLREHVRPGLVGRHSAPDRLARGHHHPVGPRDADRRRAADPQALDGLDHRGHVVAGEPGGAAGQERLVEEFEVAGGVTDPAEGDGSHRRGTGGEDFRRLKTCGHL